MKGFIVADKNPVRVRARPFFKTDKDFAKAWGNKKWWGEAFISYAVTHCASPLLVCARVSIYYERKCVLRTNMCTSVRAAMCSVYSKLI